MSALLTLNPDTGNNAGKSNEEKEEDVDNLVNLMNVKEYSVRHSRQEHDIINEQFSAQQETDTSFTLQLVRAEEMILLV